MEVSQVHYHPNTLGPWLEIQELATRQALLLIVVCSALQLNALHAAEPMAVNQTSVANQHTTSQTALVREAIPPHLTPVPLRTSRLVADRLATVPSYQSLSARTPHSPFVLPIHRPIGQLSIDIRPKSKSGSQTLPADRAAEALGELPFVVASRAEELTTATTGVSTSGAEAFAYQPLYFEQVNLERYGRYQSCLQPATSALRFFATIPALPYAMTVHNPHVAYNWNWPYAAGWAAPPVRELPPFHPRAALVESSVITGLVFLLP